MSDKEKPEVPEITILTPTKVDNEDYFTAYANGAVVAHTYFDFQLHFAETKVRDAQNIVSEGFATILMSPQHAKALLRHFTENLELYESKFGEIKLPPQLLNNISANINLTTAQGEAVDR